MSGDGKKSHMRNEHGLTPKQETFVQKYLECKNSSEAYRFAYDVGENTKENTVSWEAWELLNNPKITQRIEGLQDVASKTVLFGVKEAFEELEEARKKAEENDAPAAMVSATKGKMDLFGLGSKRLSVDATVKSEFATEEEQIAALREIIPQLTPLLIAEGWTPPDE